MREKPHRSAWAARSRAFISAPRASVSWVTRTSSRMERGVMPKAAAAGRLPSSELPQPHDHVDRRDARSVGRGDLELRQQGLGDVGQLFRILAIEMVVRPGLGVVPELGVVDGNLSEQAGAGKFVER